eukprot:scaffold13528_cov169-Amphora_coffeaeformis.AAC.1
MLVARRNSDFNEKYPTTYAVESLGGHIDRSGFDHTPRTVVPVPYLTNPSIKDMTYGSHTVAIRRICSGVLLQHRTLSAAFWLVRYGTVHQSQEQTRNPTHTLLGSVRRRGVTQTGIHRGLGVKGLVFRELAFERRLTRTTK